MKASGFKAWFKAQFGALPTASSRMNEMYDRRRGLQLALADVQAEITKAHRVEQQWQAAFYAWNAAKEKKQP